MSRRDSSLKWGPSLGPYELSRSRELPTSEAERLIAYSSLLHGQHAGRCSNSVWMLCEIFFLYYASIVEL